MSRVRSPAPDPFGHVDVAPPTGFAPVTSGLTDRRSPLLSYGGSVRVLGLEPSLFRGKSPVPYQSGVTRTCGSAGDATARPTLPGTAVTRSRGRCLCSCQGADTRTGDPVSHARKESNLLPAGLEAAASP